MFPIRDHNPSTRTPFVNYGLIALNIGIFLATLPTLSDPLRAFQLYLAWGMVPVQVSQGEGLAGLVTAMFLHAGWLHIAGNLLFLWIFGDNLEDELGHAGYLGFYLACGVGAGLAQVLAGPSSPVPTIGASGAIAGVLGGYLLLFPRARIDVLFIFIIFFRIFAIPAWIVLGLWFGLQVYNGVNAGTGTEVAYWEHAGGFALGILLIVPAWIGRGGTAFWARTHGTPPHPETRSGTSRIPVVRRPR